MEEIVLKRILRMKRAVRLFMMLAGVTVSMPLTAAERLLDLNPAVEFYLANNGEKIAQFCRGADLWHKEIGWPYDFWY